MNAEHVRASVRYFIRTQTDYSTHSIKLSSTFVGQSSLIFGPTPCTKTPLDPLLDHGERRRHPKAFSTFILLFNLYTDSLYNYCSFIFNFWSDSRRNRPFFALAFGAVDNSAISRDVAIFASGFFLSTLVSIHITSLYCFFITSISTSMDFASSIGKMVGADTRILERRPLAGGTLAGGLHDCYTTGAYCYIKSTI